MVRKSAGTPETGLVRQVKSERHDDAAASGCVDCSCGRGNRAHGGGRRVLADGEQVRLERPHRAAVLRRRHVFPAARLRRPGGYSGSVPIDTPASVTTNMPARTPLRLSTVCAHALRGGPPHRLASMMPAPPRVYDA